MTTPPPNRPCTAVRNSARQHPARRRTTGASQHVSEQVEHDRRAASSALMTDLGERKSTTAFFKSVAAQASFVAALMFYLGAMYTTSFYGYFNLTLNTLNLGFSGLVLQSLHLLRREVLVVAVIVLVAAGIPWSRFGGRFAEPTDGDGRSPLRTAAARLHLVVVGAGLVLLVMSSAIAPYGWVAPLTVAAGLLLGQCRDTRSDRRAGLRHKAVPLFAAAVFLFWALTQITWQLGERDAKERARDVTRWTGVLILSTHRLALPQDSWSRKTWESPSTLATATRVCGCSWNAMGGTTWFPAAGNHVGIRSM